MRSIDEILKSPPLVQPPAHKPRKLATEKCPTCKGRKVVERGPSSEGDAGEWIDCPQCQSEG